MRCISARTRLARALAASLLVSSPYVFAATDGAIPTCVQNEQSACESGVESPGDVTATNAAAAADYFDSVGDGSGADIAQALGEFSTAAGGNSLALGLGSSAFGYGASAWADFSLAAGYGATATGLFSTAVGGYAVLPASFFDPTPQEMTTSANGENSAAFGPGAQADATASLAMGAGAQATGDISTAIGLRAYADSPGAISIGGWSSASGLFSTAVGYQSLAIGEGTTAVGSGTRASGYLATAYGNAAIAEGVGNTAIGGIAWASGWFSTAVGSAAMAEGDRSIALGNGAKAYDEYASATGFLAEARGAGSIAFGEQANAGGFDPFPPPDAPGVGAVGATRAIAMGSFAQAYTANSVAIGQSTLVNGANSVALGSESWADRDNAVSIGAGAARTNLYYDGAQHPAFTRQLINLSAGTEDTDAVNLAQLTDVASVFGGGAGMQSGVLGGPSYNIGGQAYSDVGSAFAAVDDRLSGLQQQVDEIPPPPPPAEGPGETPTGNVISYDGDAQGQVTLAGADGTRISNLADGAAPTDAANVGQVDRGDAATLASSRTYTDSSATRTLNSANAYTDARFTTLDDQFKSLSRDIEGRLTKQDERIDRMGAMSAAMMGMAMNAGNARTPRGRISMGAGWQNGESALAVGYSKQVGDRVSLSIGGAFNDGDQSATVGMGVDL